jgi:predicted esterase
MKVIFSHGKESGPWGSKIKALAAIAEEHGCSIDSIDYQNIPDADQRAERLVEYLEQEADDFILVGSSMGGYVSLVASEQKIPKGMFLLAPALYIPGYAQQTYSCDVPVEIVHGWSDEVIPIGNSITYAQKADCTLHLIAGDHRLTASLGSVTRIFRSFLQAFTMK